MPEQFGKPLEDLLHARPQHAAEDLVLGEIPTHQPNQTWNIPARTPSLLHGDPCKELRVRTRGRRCRVEVQEKPEQLKSVWQQLFRSSLQNTAQRRQHYGLDLGHAQWDEQLQQHGDALEDGMHELRAPRRAQIRDDARQELQSLGRHLQGLVPQEVEDGQNSSRQILVLRHAPPRSQDLSHGQQHGEQAGAQGGRVEAACPLAVRACGLLDGGHEVRAHSRVGVHDGVVHKDVLRNCRHDA
mmetsp:Transcript_15427/g.44596  ORF Transcript_15427/g.44596 Transcript_15427/m.44596 type:complete len:242 (-) Transcript_15427:1575-2300(-)